jgi:hypothetical protein
MALHWSQAATVLGSFALFAAFIGSGAFGKAHPRIAWSSFAVGGLAYALAALIP